MFSFRLLEQQKYQHGALVFISTGIVWLVDESDTFLDQIMESATFWQRFVDIPPWSSSPPTFTMQLQWITLLPAQFTC